MCADNTIYTGITTDLERRVTEHNTSHLGAKYTKARRPVQLVWSQETTDRSTASKIEIELKKKTKLQKEKIIQEKEILVLTDK